jgi:4-carboxymuconolactone decarboxylase
VTPQQQEAYRCCPRSKATASPSCPAAQDLGDNPRLADAVAPLATHFGPPHHSLSQREREVAVCVIVGKWSAAFSIDAHSGILIGLGCRRKSPTPSSAESPRHSKTRGEQVIYQLATAHTDARWIPRTLYDRAVGVLGHDSMGPLWQVLSAQGRGWVGVPELGGDHVDWQARKEQCAGVQVAHPSRMRRAEEDAAIITVQQALESELQQ